MTVRQLPAKIGQRTRAHWCSGYGLPDGLPPGTPLTVKALHYSTLTATTDDGREWTLPRVAIEYECLYELRHCWLPATHPEVAGSDSVDLEPIRRLEGRKGDENGKALPAKCRTKRQSTAIPPIPQNPLFACACVSYRLVARERIAPVTHFPEARPEIQPCHLAAPKRIRVMIFPVVRIPDHTGAPFVIQGRKRIAARKDAPYDARDHRDQYHSLYPVDRSCNVHSIEAERDDQALRSAPCSSNRVEQSFLPKSRRDPKRFSN
jgi:hypothetical protein